MGSKQNNFIIEVVFILLGIAIYYSSHSGDLFESLGGMTGIGLGSLLIAYVPHSLIKSKVKNSLLKSFSVCFFLLNLLILIAS